MAAPTVRGTCTPVVFIGVSSSLIIVDTVGAVDGDILVLFWESAEAATAITAYPDGSWVQPSGFPVTGNGASCSMAYKLSAASEGATWTFTLDASTRNGIATVVIVDGSTTDNQLNGTPAGAQDTNGTSHTTPSLTTTVNDCLVLTQFGADSTGSRTWSGGGDAELMDAEESGTWTDQAIYRTTQASSGSVTKTATSSANCIASMGIIAFSPNAAAGRTTKNKNSHPLGFFAGMGRKVVS